MVEMFGEMFCNMFCEMFYEMFYEMFDAFDHPSIDELLGTLGLNVWMKCWIHLTRALEIT